MIYRIQNQRVILCGRKRLVSSPTSHTHFPGRPDGFPNISSPSPPDLGVKGTSRVACSSKAIGGRRLGQGRVATDSRVEVRSAGNPRPQPAAGGLKTPSRALFGRRKWAALGLLVERQTRDSCADEVVELVPARRGAARWPAAGAPRSQPRVVQSFVAPQRVLLLRCCLSPSLFFFFQAVSSTDESEQCNPDTASQDWG